MKCPKCKTNRLLSAQRTIFTFKALKNIVKQKQTFQCPDCGVYYAIRSVEHLSISLILTVPMFFALYFITLSFDAKVMVAFGWSLVSILIIAPLLCKTKIHFDHTALDMYREQSDIVRTSSYVLRKQFISEWQIHNCLTA